MHNPVFYQPFVSTSATVDSSLNSLQGIKENFFAANSYLIAGTTGSAISPPGYGALYVGEIDGSSTSSGSGSGSWLNFSVPNSWSPQETSAYGPDIVSPGSGPGGIGNVDLAGTWINSCGTLLGWFYRGAITSLSNDTPGSTTLGFKSFRAKTNLKLPARYTYLHSVDGGYAVGNYTTAGGPIALAINSGPDSGSFVYNPRTNYQINIRYPNGARYHSAFGIWSNENSTYTISGGAALDQFSPTYNILSIFKMATTVKSVLENIRDAALGQGMLADVDPVTGIASNVQYYNFNNRPDMLTHFQGIYYVGDGVYQAPFVAVDSNGEAHTGNAYMLRLSTGEFSEKAIWQTFEPDRTGGSAFISTSVAGDANTGVYSTLSPFASISISGQNQHYHAAALNLANLGNPI